MVEPVFKPASPEDIEKQRQQSDERRYKGIADALISLEKKIDKINKKLSIIKKA